MKSIHFWVSFISLWNVLKIPSVVKGLGQMISFAVAVGLIDDLATRGLKSKHQSAFLLPNCWSLKRIHDILLRLLIWQELGCSYFVYEYLGTHISAQLHSLSVSTFNLSCHAAQGEQMVHGPFHFKKELKIHKGSIRPVIIWQLILIFPFCVCIQFKFH
jgi:hypothetical protein